MTKNSICTICFILMLIVFSKVSLAAINVQEGSCPQQREFLVEGNSTSLCWSEGLHAWISKQCMEKSQKACGALAFSEAAKNKKTELDQNDRRGGKNPGSVLCSKLGGRVMYATLSSGSQVTFCEAKDKTLIDCNALTNQFFSN